MLQDWSLYCRQTYDGFIKPILGSRPTQGRRETTSPVLD